MRYCQQTAGFVVLLTYGFYFHIFLKKKILSLQTKAHNGLGLNFYADRTFFYQVFTRSAKILHEKWTLEISNQNLPFFIRTFGIGNH